MISIGACSPYASAARPASVGERKPPVISPIPTTTPVAVATCRTEIVSEGIVAMKIGNTPLADQPINTSVPRIASGPW